MEKRTFIFLADGFEIIEGMAVLDVLTRNHLEVNTVSINGTHRVVSAQNVAVEASMIMDDSLLADINTEDIMVFPGGLPGASNLADCSPLMTKMQDHYAKGGVLAAICAAPGLILSKLPLEEIIRTKGSLSMTCYKGTESELEKRGVTICDPVKTGVVKDGNIITASGPGHSIDFALQILNCIRGPIDAGITARSLML